MPEPTTVTHESMTCTGTSEYMDTVAGGAGSKGEQTVSQTYPYLIQSIYKQYLEVGGDEDAVIIIHPRSHSLVSSEIQDSLALENRDDSVLVTEYMGLPIVTDYRIPVSEIAIASREAYEENS